MKQIDKIRRMSVEELAKFLICSSIEEDTDYDWNEQPYTITHPCYVTPFCEYSHLWDYTDVLNDTIRILLNEGENNYDAY